MLFVAMFTLITLLKDINDWLCTSARHSRKTSYPKEKCLLRLYASPRAVVVGVPTFTHVFASCPKPSCFNGSTIHCNVCATQDDYVDFVILSGASIHAYHVSGGHLVPYEAHCHIFYKMLQLLCMS